MRGELDFFHTGGDVLHLSKRGHQGAPLAELRMARDQLCASRLLCEFAAQRHA